MKYFTKYLPVEGEIKEGDTGITPKGTISKCIRESDTSGIPFIVMENGGSFNIGSCKKLKLFLCSRDIQVGDKFYNTEIPNKEYLASHITSSDVDCSVHDCSVPRKYVYKVIGEVSPEAIWVKEGDEFDEKDVRFQILHNNFEVGIEDTIEEAKAHGYVEAYHCTFIAKIKCSNCKTFH